MNYLRTVIALTVAAFLATFTAASAASSFDSQTATIQKGCCAKMAKVKIKKEAYSAPISFEDGADWSTVKDHYEVSDQVVSGIEKHKVMIKIGSDGKATYTFKKK